MPKPHCFNSALVNLHIYRIPIQRKNILNRYRFNRLNRNKVSRMYTLILWWVTIWTKNDFIRCYVLFYYALLLYVKFIINASSTLLEMSVSKMALISISQSHHALFFRSFRVPTLLRLSFFRIGNYMCIKWQVTSQIFLFFIFKTKMK